MKPSHLRQYDWIDIRELITKLDYLKDHPNPSEEKELRATLKCKLDDYFKDYQVPYNPHGEVVVDDTKRDHCVKTKRFKSKFSLTYDIKDGIF